MKRTLLMLLLGGLSPVLAASEQQFAFALPELEGRISLGVFNESKQLVRTLRVQATEADFTIGINGLIATWDGKNEAGQDQPAGKYFVRGYVVGNAVKSEGIDYHFNDWIESENSPPLQNPQLIHASGDDMFLVGSNGLVCSYREGSGLRKVFNLPGGAQFRGGGIFETPAGLFTLDYSAPERSESFAGEGVASAARWQDKLYLAPAYGSPIRHLKVLSPVPIEIDSPADIRLLDANHSALVASDQRHVWIFQGKKFEQVPFAEEINVISLSAGLGETFWMTGQVTTAGMKSPPFIRQYSFSGEILRQSTCETPTTIIFADKTKERIFLSESFDSEKKTIKGLRPLSVAEVSSKTDEKVVDWEVFLEKSSTECRAFGLVNGHLEANAGDVPNTCAVRPAESLQSTRQSIDLQVHANSGEIWLQTSEGLRLLSIGLLEGAERCVVAPAGSEGALKVYAGNGAVVAEYLVTGADQVAEIDAGEIDLP